MNAVVTPLRAIVPGSLQTYGDDTALLDSVHVVDLFSATIVTKNTIKKMKGQILEHIPAARRRGFCSKLHGCRMRPSIGNVRKPRSSNSNPGLPEFPYHAVFSLNRL